MLGTFGDLVAGVAPPRFCFLRRCFSGCLRLCFRVCLRVLYLVFLYVFAIIYSMLLKNIQKIFVCSVCYFYSKITNERKIGRIFIETHEY